MALDSGEARDTNCINWQSILLGTSTGTNTLDISDLRPAVDIETMPGSLSTNASKQESRKRKRSETTEKPEKSSTKGKRDSSSQAVTKRPTSPNSTQQFPALVSGRLTSQEDILELEEAIIESQKNYNGIVLLLECLQVRPDAPVGYPRWMLTPATETVL